MMIMQDPIYRSVTAYITAVCSYIYGEVHIRLQCRLWCMLPDKFLTEVLKTNVSCFVVIFVEL